MVQAEWNGQVIAESEKTIVVEGNHYFPPESVKKEFFADSETHTTCSWKGEASYNSVVVNGKTNPDAAWHYPTPLEKAANITGHYAFWKGVAISE
jgi:uncharacterized protein (DUF427 family)